MRQINPTGGCGAAGLRGKDLAQNWPLGPLPVDPLFGIPEEKAPLVLQDNGYVIPFSSVTTVAEAITNFIGIADRVVEVQGAGNGPCLVLVSPLFLKEIILPSDFTGMVLPGAYLTPVLIGAEYVSNTQFDTTADADDAVARAVSVSPCPCDGCQQVPCPPDSADPVTVTGEGSSATADLATGDATRVMALFKSKYVW